MHNNIIEERTIYVYIANALLRNMWCLVVPCSRTCQDSLRMMLGIVLFYSVVETILHLYLLELECELLATHVLCERVAVCSVEVLARLMPSLMNNNIYSTRLCDVEMSNATMW